MTGGFQVYCTTPLIGVYDHFATQDEVATLRQHGLDPEGAQTYASNVGHNTTGFSFEWPVTQHPVTSDISQRIAGAVGIVNQHGFSMRFRHYEVGEGHPPHLDCYEADGVHLVATAMLYLNEPEKGGETWFDAALPQPVAIVPSPGRLAVWINYTADGQPDPLANHEGRPVTDGTKTTLTAFIYTDATTRPSFEAHA